MEDTKQETKDIVREIDRRSQVIVRTSIVGIVVNVLLAAMKAAVGLLANSIAVVLDAVNNLSDALSSIITIVGAKLAGRLPDRKHPLGYGRIEYLSTMIVSALVLYAGITALVESVKKIIHPEQADYSILSLVLIAVAVAAKLLLGRYVKSQGEKVNSGSLIASGSDASFDAVLSASVLVCALLFMFTGISLEAYVGVVIAAFIIKSGIEMMLDTVNDILGQRVEPEESQRIKQLVCEDPQVLGAYDLQINNYGPGKNYASIHVELPETLTAKEIDRLTRGIQSRVYRETETILTCVGVYSANTKEGETMDMQKTIREKILAHEGVLQIHGLYIDTELKELRFDVVFSFEADRKTQMQEMYREIGELYPEYSLTIVPDVDLSD